MAKAHLKMKLAARLGIPILTVTHSDTGDLASIFSKWLLKGAPPTGVKRAEVQDCR
jgi:hypothetical protein